MHQHSNCDQHPTEIGRGITKRQCPGNKRQIVGQPVNNPPAKADNKAYLLRSLFVAILLGRRAWMFLVLPSLLRAQSERPSCPGCQPALAGSFATGQMR